MNEFLKAILDGIHTVIPSYGWTVVAFTILVRLCIMPLDYKSRVGMRKMSKLAPEQAKLQQKYAKDQEKLQRKLSELYRKEHVSPMSSCWPLLLTFPVMIAMFAALRMMANEELIKQTFDLILTGNTQMEPFLWIKNLWMPDSPFSAAWPSLSSLQTIPKEDWLRVLGTLPADTVAALGNQIGVVLEEVAFDRENLQATIAAINTALTALPEYASNTAAVPYLSINLLITQLTVVSQWNGLFLLPLLSAGSQFLMTALQPASPAPAPAADGKPQPNTGAFMKWFFPLFSLWICAGYNAAFAVYWVTANLVSMLQTFLINKYLDRKDALAAATPNADASSTGNMK